MRVLVNALSATAPSGKQVLLGHLPRLARWTAGKHEFHVLYHQQNADLVRDLGPNVRWIQAPAKTAHWMHRSVWERTCLGRTVRNLRADLYFTPSGTVARGLGIPQVSLALNPWCLVPRVHRGLPDRVKASLQRQAYREAVHRSTLLGFASRYLRDAYRQNAGREEQSSEIVYCAPDDRSAAVFEDRARFPRPDANRIVCASVMAPHKGVETVVEALALLRREHHVPATLYLVGGWPDRSYQQLIGAAVSRLGLEQHVHLTGHVSREELLDHYARASVFCLMSWCESFGIPAIEAQSLGTPVVSSNCCAIPEVCGEGGLYPEPGDAAGTAQALARVLTDQATRDRLSALAVENSTRFRYDITSRPLLRMFDVA